MMRIKKVVARFLYDEAMELDEYAEFLKEEDFYATSGIMMMSIK